MADIRFAVPPADRAAAGFVNRRIVQLILRIQQVQLAAVRINVSVSSISGRQYAVKEIYAALHSL